MRSSRSPRAFAALALLVVLAGCSTFSYKEEVVVLENTTWRILEVDGYTARRNSNRDLSPHLHILSADGTVHGAGGCNRFSGPYRASGTEIGFGPLVTTRSICADETRQRIEDRIVAALEAADGYRLEGKKLWIYAGGEARIEAELW